MHNKQHYSKRIKNMQNNSTFLKWSLIVGIVVVLNLFFNYSVYLVYPEPQFENYCKVEQVKDPIVNKDQCVNAGGQWNSNPNYGKQVTPLPLGYVPEQAGYCDEQFSCRKEYEDAHKTYQRTVFISLIVLGVASILAAFFTTMAPVVSTALSFGGALSFIIASVRYWAYAQTLLQVVILGVALAALIWLGVKKFSKES